MQRDAVFKFLSEVLDVFLKHTIVQAYGNKNIRNIYLGFESVLITSLRPRDALGILDG